MGRQQKYLNNQVFSTKLHPLPLYPSGLNAIDTRRAQRAVNKVGQCFQPAGVIGRKGDIE